MARRPSRHVDSAAATGVRIREARRAAGLSQRQLAFDGCTAAYVSRIEAGARTPSFQILRVFAEKLGVTADYLATGDTTADGVAAADHFLEAELAARAGDVSTAQRIYREAQNGGSLRAVARATFGLGRIEVEAGNQRAAVDHLERALASKLLPRDEATAATEMLGRAYALLARHEDALSVFGGALAEAEAINDLPTVMRFTVLLANALIDRGSFGGAEEVLASILESARASSDPVTLSNLYWSQSRLHSSQGRPDLAAHYARMAHATLEATEHTVFAARALLLLAHIENDRGNAQAALDLVADGIGPVAASGNRLDRGMLLLEKARALAALGQPEEAAGIALGVIPSFEGAHPTSAGRGYAVAAGIIRDLGDREKAFEIYELAAATLPTNDRHLVDVYKELAGLCEEAGRTGDGMRYLKLALEVQDTPTLRAHVTSS
jgi:transcriptional regulator with XRE-family HTH domain